MDNTENLAEISLDLIEGGETGNIVPPAWIHILPLGTFRGKDGRGPYTLANPQAVIDATRTYFGKNDMPIDYEHQILWSRGNGQPAPAAGWIQDLQARLDGIWGKVEWTAQAQAMIKNREYRYVSPVFCYNSREITRLTCVALTNSPNLELTALATADPLVSLVRPIPTLTQTEEDICARMGLRPEDFLNAKTGERAVTARAMLSTVDLAVCRVMGVSPEDYLTTRNQDRQAAGRTWR